MPKKHPTMKLAKKRNGRYMVKKRGGGLVNGPDKTKFLQESGVVKVLKAKAKDAAAE
jgi:hypothetical protein